MQMLFLHLEWYMIVFSMSNVIYIFTNAVWNMILNWKKTKTDHLQYNKNEIGIQIGKFGMKSFSAIPDAIL